MRLIDEDALVDALMTYTWRDEDERTIDDADEKREYIKGWLPNVPTVGGWISVKDRLPEKNGRYLCRYEQKVYGEVCRCTDFGIYDSDIGESGGWFVGKVTHWMPLPEKPKEESND